MADDEKLVLKTDVLRKYLTNLTYTDDRQAFQCDTLSLEGRKIESLGKDMNEVSFIRKLNLANNSIVDIAVLANFKKLISIYLSGNKIKSLNVFSEEENFPVLRRLEMAGNKLGELPAIKCPKLEYIDLSDNKIDKHETWVGHPTLRVIKFNENKLKSLAAFANLPSLEYLDVANNNIGVFGGFSGLEKLQTIILENNKIDKIEEEIPELPSIQEINLNSTKITNIENLRFIFKYDSLRSLSISDTPLENNASSFNFLLSELMIIFPKLKSYCNVEITDQHRFEAVYLSKYRWEKKEEERIRKEEE
jgi:Leucine-rich repeat (LRR) protein